MESIDLSGLTYEQAVARAEKEIGQPLPEDTKEVIRIKAGLDGGAIHDLQMTKVKVSLAELIMEFLSEDEEIPYNGVFGDSCDNPSCNARRALSGPNIIHDMENGLSPAESIQSVHRGYGGKEKTPPHADVTGVNVKTLIELLDILKDVQVNLRKH